MPCWLWVWCVSVITFVSKNIILKRSNVCHTSNLESGKKVLATFRMALFKIAEQIKDLWDIFKQVG